MLALKFNPELLISADIYAVKGELRSAMKNKSLFKMQHSIRTRIIFSVLVMILPAAVLLYIAHNALRTGIDSLTHIVDAPVNELVTVKKIQSTILRTELPFYLYMNRGETADRESFIRLAVDIDLMFQKLINTFVKGDNEKRLADTAQSEWLEAKSLGESLLTLSNIPENAELVAKIDQFSRHLERSVSLLEEFSDHSIDEIQNQRFYAQDGELKTITVLILVFSLGLVLALLAAISLGQSVIQPVKQLEKTVNKFGQGDTSTRITLNSKDELGSLANAFNRMAERYEQIKQELDYLSIHDSLTGLYDQSKLLREISIEIERAKRYDRSFAVLLIDINNFKKVNQEYGHLVGDSVLCSVANKIKSTIRPTDIASRYGGDEFGVILSETDIQGARDTAQRIVDAIEQNPLNLGDGKTLEISVKISHVTYPEDADTETTLVAMAEQLLSQSRNKISFFNKRA